MQVNNACDTVNNICGEVNSTCIKCACLRRGLARVQSDILNVHTQTADSNYGVHLIVPRSLLRCFGEMYGFCLQGNIELQ
jgi:hypothetical protein